MNIFTKIFKRNIINTGKSNSHFSHTADVITGRDATSFSAIDLICSAFANLGGQFYNVDDKQPLKEYYLYDLINNPNYDETRFIFFYNSAKDIFSAGNCYWYKYDNEQHEIVSLFRINPNVVKVKKDTFNQKVYIINGVEYRSDKILHIPSRFGYDGLIGKSIFDECNQIFANSKELDLFTNNSFNNSVGNRLIIDITKEFPNATEEQIQALRNKFLNNYTGIQNAGKPLIKSGKIDYSKIETDYKDNKANQLIENREFQEREIAKIFGIPVLLMSGGQLTGTTNTIESLYILFIENALRPIATQFEQSINRLISPRERSKIYFEYSYNSLMKTTLDTRISAYTKQMMNGILSVNEIRRKENLPEIEAGDNHFVPANLMPLTDEVISSYMANSRLKLEQLKDKENNHEAIGDDKQ